MKTTKATILIMALVGMFISMNVFGQDAGDYRSAATGNWNDASTWEIFDGTDWEAALNPPTGTETIHVWGEDTVTVVSAVSISGYVKVEGDGHLTVDSDTGTMEFGDGSTYEHARDGGSVPIATWETGSTFFITGSVGSAPGNRNQSYYHVVFETDSLLSNLNMDLDDAIIGGDVTVISTGSARWYLTSASAGDSTNVTIMGDVIVQDGQFAVQGTGNALTGFFVHHYGNIIVTGGNFSIARGSQGNGSGTTVWYLHDGDFSMANATTQNSNPTNARFVFANNGTQQLTFDNVNYAGGGTNIEVADTTVLEITEDFFVRGSFVNKGEVTPAGTFTVGEQGTYEHARNGGSIPTAVWEEGSTALFTGITSSAPSNRGQDYYNLILNTPDLGSNLNLDMSGNTISGDIHVISTGSGRWQFFGGNSDTVTVMGDVIMEAGQFTTQGTGSATDVVVHHYGDIVVTGGNFAISRGSQASGTGTTTWFLYEGDFSLTDARTENSNPTSSNAKFMFAKDGIQQLTLSNVDYGPRGLPIEIASGTTLDMGMTVLEGAGPFTITDGGVLATAQPDGIDGALLNTGDITFASGAGFMFNGTETQVPGTMLPDSIGALIIANPEGVAFNDTLWSTELHIASEAIMLVDTIGNVSVNAGTVDGTIVTIGSINAEESLVFGDGSVYNHARDGGSVPNGVWNEGSTFLLTGIVGSAPGNRNQNFYNVTFNTPDQISNLNMGFDEVTISGDIHVISTGTARWYLTSASAGDSTVVTLMGDVIVEDGQFSVQGTGNALTVFDVHHYGNIEVTGGNFSIARGSQGDGSGSTRWYLYEGDFSMENATTQNSNQTNAWFVFDSENTQYLILGEGNTINSLPIEVVNGTTLDFGTSELGGNGIFILNEDATLATGHEDGIAGTIQTTGDVTFDENANYTFNGTVEQVTSELMPVIVNNLTIDNEAGVELSQETTINGILLLANGEFDNTISFILGPDAEIVYENGTLRFPVSVEQQIGLPTEFAMTQNYPNPFNPSTTIRFDVPEQTFVTLKIYDITGREVAELVSDEFSPGIYTVEWNAQGVASGVYYYRITAGEFTQVRSLVFMK